MLPKTHFAIKTIANYARQMGATGLKSLKIIKSHDFSKFKAARNRLRRAASGVPCKGRMGYTQ